jgi:hypothetical protein
MARGEEVLDGRPGRPPEIRTDVRGVVITLTPPGLPRSDRLVIRCDATGELWTSIRPAATPKAP